MATKWQVRSNALTEGEEPSLSVIEAEHVQPLDGGGLAFTDVGGFVVCLIQKDSWIDVVRIP